MIKRLAAPLTAVVLWLIAFAAPALAACTNPISINNNVPSSVGMSTQTGDDGNCAPNAGPHKWYLGSSNNGLYSALLTLESIELNALANGAVAVSSVGGTSGLFNNSNTGGAQLGEIFFTSGATATCTAGGNISIWFLQTGDGTTFETATAAQMVRSPDAIIFLPTAAISTNTYKAPGPINVPALQFKVMTQNNCGAALGGTGNLIKLAPIAGQN
jgi:hypothetical protein